VLLLTLNSFQHPWPDDLFSVVFGFDDWMASPSCLFDLFKNHGHLN